MVAKKRAPMRRRPSPEDWLASAPDSGLPVQRRPPVVHRPLHGLRRHRAAAGRRQQGSGRSRAAPHPPRAAGRPSPVERQGNPHQPTDPRCRRQGGAAQRASRAAGWAHRGPADPLATGRGLLRGRSAHQARDRRARRRVPGAGRTPLPVERGLPSTAKTAGPSPTESPRRAAPSSPSTLRTSWPTTYGPTRNGMSRPRRPSGSGRWPSSPRTHRSSTSIPSRTTRSSAGAPGSAPTPPRA